MSSTANGPYPTANRGGIELHGEASGEVNDLGLMMADLLAGALIFVVHKLPLGKRLGWGLLAAIGTGWFALRFRPFTVPLDEATAERLVQLGQSAALVATIVGLSIMSSRMWETDPPEPEPTSPPPDRTAGLSPRRESGRPRWAQWWAIMIRYMPAEVMIMYGSVIGLFAMLEPDEDLGMGLTGLAVAAVGAVFTWLRLRSL